MSPFVLPKPRWFHPTPGRLLLLLLAVEGVLVLSKPWFPKGWAVLTAIAAVIVTMVLMLIWWFAALLFHWRFQFSLRSLLVATVAVAIPFSWLAVEMKKGRQQREAVEAILTRGGEVGYGWGRNAQGQQLYYHDPPGKSWLQTMLGGDFFGEVLYIHFDRKGITDADLEPLEGLTLLKHLGLSQNPITDAGLQRLKDLNHLQTLELDSTQITDKGLEHLQRLSALDFLEISRTQITDAGLKNLEGVNRLRSLRLSETRITDKGLEHLEGLHHLTTLYLSQTGVTDAGLRNLARLTNLQRLDLRETKVTDAGVAELQKALPGLKIRR